MRDNVKNVNKKQENMRLNSINSKKNEFVNRRLVKNYQTFHKINFFIIFVCIYKIYIKHLISAEGYKNAGVHFLRVWETGKILGVKNMSDLVLKKHTVFIKKTHTHKKNSKIQSDWKRSFCKIW